MARNLFTNPTSSTNFTNNPKRVSEDDIMMERIKKAKEEIEEDESVFARISSKTSPREMVYYFSEMFSKMGIEIELKHEDTFLMPESKGDIMSLLVRRLSDQNVRRMIEIKDGLSQSSKKTITIEEHERLMKNLIEDLKKKEETDSGPRRLMRDIDGNLEWIKGKSIEEIGEKNNHNTDRGAVEWVKKLVNKDNKNSEHIQENIKEPSRKETEEYKEKIKWFCKKYKEDYDVIYESFKNDNLDNISWKGEKIEFPEDLINS